MAPVRLKLDLKGRGTGDLYKSRQLWECGDFAVVFCLAANRSARFAFRFDRCACTRLPR